MNFLFLSNLNAFSEISVYIILYYNKKMRKSRRISPGYSTYKHLQHDHWYYNTLHITKCQVSSQLYYYMLQRIKNIQT